MYRLPSIQILRESFQATLRRVPFALLTALLKTVLLVGIMEAFRFTEDQSSIIMKLSLAGTILMPLMIAWHLISERRQISRTVFAAGIAAAVVLVSLFYCSFSPTPSETDYYRFAIYFIAVHLVVSFAPFAGYSEPNGFWQFNKYLFLQALLATIYAVTLFLGLLIAVSTVRFLFKIEYGFQIEADLAAVIFGFFHTVFFLNGLPKNLASLENERNIPKELKIFTQYVLLPLEVVYLAILYAYLVRILLRWELPEGGVAYLVLAFSVAGILALLLIYPLRNDTAEKWVRIFSRRFYVALFPLIGLLFTGITRRISDYGFTENRYLVLVLAIWLSGISLYYLFSRRKDIRWIPVTLTITCLVISGGPWGVFAVARQSQLDRFEALLTSYKMLDSRRVISGAADVSAEDYGELLSIMRYFNQKSDLKALYPFFGEPGNNQGPDYSALELRLNTALHVRDAQGSKDTYFSYSPGAAGSGSGLLVPLRGYDDLWQLTLNSTERNVQGALEATLTKAPCKLSLARNGNIVVTWDLDTRIGELLQTRGPNASDVDREKLTFTHRGKEGSYTLIVTGLYGTRRSRISLNGLLLISAPQAGQ